MEPELESMSKFFWDYVARGNEQCSCWLWMRAKDRDGYGAFTWADRQFKAHRIAYELFHGQIEDPCQCVCHRCDNPACCNPEHLVLATRAENLYNMINKGRDNFWGSKTKQQTAKASTEWGQWVANARLQRGLTKKTLAHLACVDRSYITHIENYGYVPTNSVVTRIANALMQDSEEAILIAARQQMKSETSRPTTPLVVRTEDKTRTLCPREPTHNRAWAQFIEDGRKRAGLTRRELAAAANVDPSYATLWERDGYVPRPNVVKRIAEVFHIDPSEAVLIAAGCK